MQVEDTKRTVVIVGCARDCEAFLPKVLQNVSRIANLYSHAAFVFVENDSKDNTRQILQRWLSERESSFLVCLNGLAAREKRRTARLAIARNAYMEAMHYHHLANLDHLLVVDFDIVNTDLISEDSIVEAIKFLDSSSQNAAVFANQLPYYDIWALRHDVWCPDDCWVEIENRPAYFARHRAIERYVTSRQITISPDTPPVAVRSAFGGLGIYKLNFVRAARYVGLRPDGFEICEHVAFNEAAVQKGGILYIYPRLLNRPPPEHMHPPFSGLRRLTADLDPRSYPLLRLYKRRKKTTP
jgi:hypothetical protein